MSIYNDVIEMIVAGRDHNGVILFNTPLKVKLTPHTDMYEIIGVTCIDNKICVYDNGIGELPMPVKEQDTIIVNSLYQRLKTPQQQSGFFEL